MATYRMVEGQSQADVSAAYLLVLTLMGYVVDLVLAINSMGMVPLFGLSGHSLVVIGGILIGAGGFAYFLARAPRLIGDESLRSSQYRIFRYFFFCAPVAIFLTLLFLIVTFNTRVN